MEEAPAIEAIDMSRWIEEALGLSDDFVAKVERRAHLESEPHTRAMFAVVAGTVTLFRLNSTEPNKEHKLPAMMVIGAMMEPFVADLRRACEERYEKSN